MKFSKIMLLAGVARRIACVAGQHTGTFEYISMGPSQKPKKKGRAVAYYRCDACGRLFEKDL